MEGTIFSVQRNSFVDGPGIRTTVFLKGCNLHCLWCHNPESQSPAPQLLYDRRRCTGCGACRAVCPHHLETCTLCGACVAECSQGARRICGSRISSDALLAQVLRDRVFYEASGGGVTVSGGECMLQIDFLAEFLTKCRREGLSTAVDTAGCVPWSSFERILPVTDLFLYDVKALTEDLHRAGTGVSNRRILANLRRLSDEWDGDVRIRIPVIGDYNASREELTRIRDFLATTRFRTVDLLCYNAMSGGKYEEAGMTYTAFRKPTPEEMASYREIFRFS